MPLDRKSQAPTPTDAVRVTMIVRDSRGFTHYYEELETTPDAVRDGFDLMARAGRVSAARLGDILLQDN